MHIDILFLVILVASFAVVVLIALALNRHWKSTSYRLETALSAIKIDELQQVTIPDGLGDRVAIERLLLTKQGLLLIETYHIEGHLFGAEHIEQWTQLIKGRSYQFTNPLRHIKMVQQALKLIAPDVPIFYRVIMCAKADFPKGKPDEVILLTDLVDEITNLQQQSIVKGDLKQTWVDIDRLARKNDNNL